MYRKSNTFDGVILQEGFVKGEIPYQVDNLFYEIFGMSADEIIHALRESPFPDTPKN